jgi:hypothetical protein
VKCAAERWAKIILLLPEVGLDAEIAALEPLMRDGGIEEIALVFVDGCIAGVIGRSQLIAFTAALRNAR